MKRFLAVLLILVCITGVSASGESLKNLSVDELRLMIQMINAEIVSRPEWKGTEVPPGEWIVGKDIPVGEYSISAINGKRANIKIEGPYVPLSTSFWLNQGIKTDEEAIGRVVLEKDYVVTVSISSLWFAPALTLGF